MSWLTHLIRPKIRSLGMKQELPDHLWNKCSGCSQMVFHKDLSDNLFVCSHCSYPMRWPSEERLKNLFDEGTYHSLEIPSVTPDPLSFRDQKRYSDRLKEARQKTQLKDAVIIASGHLHTMPLVVVCFNFDFIGGSMGMAVGESLLAAAQLAIDQKATLLTIPASGGARMQEGILSLMQMPRSILAIEMVREEKLLTLTLLTNPTTGGVAASFASLADITLAEPQAIIGFTGARVIEETLRQPLPKGFQTAEFQKDRGFVDLIVSRNECRSTLKNIISLLMYPQKGTPLKG